MRFSVCDLREAGSPAVDLALGAYAADTTLGELMAAAGLARLRPGDETVLDGVPVAPNAPLGHLALASGSMVTLRRGHDPVFGPLPLVDLIQTAGPDSGTVIGLGPGEYAAGRGGPGFHFGAVRQPALRIAVDDTGGCTVTVVQPGDVRVDGQPMSTGDTKALEWAYAPGRAPHGSVIAAGGAVFRLAPARPTVSSGAGPVDAHGRVPLIRTPRVATPMPPAEVPVPDPPAPAPNPAPMSWLLMLAPLPIGIVMAFVFSPFFLIMTMMTPLMGLARWVEGRYRARKEAARMATESAAAAQRFADDLDGVRDAVAAADRAAHPDLGLLRYRASSGRDLWQVRPADPDQLRVSLGTGTRAWQPDLGRRGEHLHGRPELEAALADRARLVDVPILVGLRDRAGLGIVGPALVSRRLAAAVVLDLVTRHGPADIAVGVLAGPSVVAEWDWVKWLPHLAGDDGTPMVATDADSAVTLLNRLLNPPSRSPERPTAMPRARIGTGRDDDAGPRCTVLVIDGDDLLTGAVAALLGRLPTARTIVVASRVRRLPSVCQSIVEADRHGTAVLTDALTGSRVDGFQAALATPEICVGTARSLARWTDPEQAAQAALLPDRARLAELLADSGAVPMDEAVIGAQWHRRAPGLQATIGVTEHGPLAVDLLADGPHGLIVGTTGAGKSELLRTLVASLACQHSPDQLSFLLVDFKGGGAFDACAGLPHTVGVVTDLDEHLAARALRCLRAELRHRERRLREAGVSDLRDLAAPVPPLPRLVIVIDEFATLAVELPGFLTALVDVAQRGRSLGIHLLLATQRPQGVVDGKIRANTNLRVALRVQDDIDSRDVLGTTQAADIDRRRPGRGYARFGAGEIVAFQSALVSAPIATDVAARVEVESFSLLPGSRPVPRTAGVLGDQAETDLQVLVAGAVRAFQEGGYARPRVPWPPPLPDVVNAWAVDAESTVVAGPIPLGVVDLPDEQRSDDWLWEPETGGTLVLGADSAATTTVLATACLGLARHRHPDRQRMFVLDGSGCGLPALAALPHIAAAVGTDDGERLSRVLDALDAELIRRRTPGAGTEPELLVVVAGWAAVVEAAEQAGAAEVGSRLERLLRDGGPAGIRMLISAGHERGVPGRVLTQLPTKVCLRLADPAGYTGLGLRAREVPELRGLRAIDLQTRHELVLARYGDGSPAAIAEAAGRVAAAYPDAVQVPTIGILPEVIAADEVVRASALTAGAWQLGIGRSYRDLGIASLALAAGMHGVVAGPPGSGRTTALRVLAAAARRSAPDAPICVVTTDPVPWVTDQVTELVESLGELHRWPGSGRALLLVDGVEALGPAAGAELDAVIAAAPPTAHVIVAGRAEVFRGIRVWQRAVTMSRTGVLLRPAPDDGDILRIRLPRETLRSIPGRGYLVDAGGLAQIQVASRPAAAQVLASSALEVT